VVAAAGAAARKLWRKLAKKLKHDASVINRREKWRNIEKASAALA